MKELNHVKIMRFLFYLLVSCGPCLGADDSSTPVVVDLYGREQGVEYRLNNTIRDIAALKEILKKIGEHETNDPIIIRTDRATKFSDVFSVVPICREAGLKRWEIIPHDAKTDGDETEAIVMKPDESRKSSIAPQLPPRDGEKKK